MYEMYEICKMYKIYEEYKVKGIWDSQAGDLPPEYDNKST